MKKIYAQEEDIITTAKCMGAVSPLQVVNILKGYSIQIDALDEICNELRLEYPGLFWTRIE